MNKLQKMTYENALEILSSQGKFRISLGLERISRILELLGNPQDDLKIIHVAGTNGKGSVCATLESILRASNYKTGLYTSPHLISYTERIKINGDEISKNDFSDLFCEVFKICEKHEIASTEFEILTAMAFLSFKKTNVDIAVIETGLGGRFDATNVVNYPLCSVITSIDLDHVDRLGSTIDDIAFEKAGIIKENSSVVVLNTNKGLDIIKKVAENKNTKIIISADEYRLQEDFNLSNGINSFEFALKGEFQGQNLALILDVIKYLNDARYEIPDIALKNGLKTVKWPARFEYYEDKNLVIDGAHNVNAAIELRKSIDTYFAGKQVVWLYSSINTKDYKNIADILFKLNDIVIFAEFNSQSSVKISDFEKLKNVNNLYLCENLNDAFEVLKKYNGDNVLRVVAGSFYMIGEAYSFLNKL